MKRERRVTAGRLMGFAAPARWRDLQPCRPPPLHHGGCQGGRHAATLEFQPRPVREVGVNPQQLIRSLTGRVELSGLAVQRCDDRKMNKVRTRRESRYGVQGFLVRSLEQVSQGPGRSEERRVGNTWVSK